MVIGQGRSALGTVGSTIIVLHGTSTSSALDMAMAPTGEAQRALWRAQPIESSAAARNGTTTPGSLMTASMNSCRHASIASASPWTAAPAGRRPGPGNSVSESEGPRQPIIRQLQAL